MDRLFKRLNEQINALALETIMLDLEDALRFQKEYQDKRIGEILNGKAFFL